MHSNDDITSQQKALQSSTNSHLSALKERYEVMKSIHEEQTERLDEEVRQGSPLYN